MAGLHAKYITAALQAATILAPGQVGKKNLVTEIAAKDANLVTYMFSSHGPSRSVFIS